MGGRKPGPTCATTGDDIDDGTLCRQRSEPRGPLGARATALPKLQRISFAALWEAYPDKKPYVDSKTKEPPKGYENQCAIKVSVAFHGVGVDLRSFSGAFVSIHGKRAAVRAQELAKWMETQHLPGVSPASPVTGENWQEKIKGRSGIVYFANYWNRPGETKAPTGDHIDLWNGSRLTASGLEGIVVTALRFGLGVSSGPGFSDLGKATRILFWEVR